MNAPILRDYVGKIKKTWLTALVAGVCSLAVSPGRADAAPAMRYLTDTHGNFTMFGNTVGYDCSSQVANAGAPVVGDLDRNLLGIFNCGSLLQTNDSGIDVFWRSYTPASNPPAWASAGVLGGILGNILGGVPASDARSTAVLKLPAGANVLYARLYWAAQRAQGAGPSTQVTVERPGIFSRNITANPTTDSKTVDRNGLTFYQSSQDITSLVRTYGDGAYRVSGINSIDVRYSQQDIAFIAWNVVVVYRLDSEPTRNIAIFDGLDYVEAGKNADANLSGFLVPSDGSKSQMGVIAYEGDATITGDKLLFNGTQLADAQNPANDFFNRTRSNLGAAVSVAGDLPQLTGKPGSMAGYDADVVDVTSFLKANDKTAAIRATSDGDAYFLGVFVTAVATFKPVFSQTVKTVKNVTRSDGRYLPGDTIEYAVTTKNTGNDIGTLVTLTDVLPTALTYKTGSLFVDNVAKTDAKDTDTADYDTATRTVIFRLGNGANGTTGGTMAIGATSTVRFQATINTAATGTVSNTAFVSALGQTAAMQGLTTPVIWSSGSVSNPIGSTDIVIVTSCTKNADCPANAPICDMTTTPAQCVCKTNADCSGGLVCNPNTKTCTQCAPGSTMNCNGNIGSICLPDGTCGCNSNNDCGGRTCDTTTSSCPPADADLSVTVTRTPAGDSVAVGTTVTYTVTVTNNGGAALSGVTLKDQLNPAIPGGMWTCVGQNGVTCPQTSGNGSIDAVLTLPAGGKAVYTVTVPLPNDPATMLVEYTATAGTPPGYLDTNPADNTVTDTLAVLPGGPDLSIRVTESTAPDGTSVLYTIDVHNSGPGAADGATVTYTIPEGSTVKDVDAGQGWSCMVVERTLTCTRTEPIPVGDASPIKLTVIPPMGATTIPLDISVKGTDGNGQPLADPNPADNTISRNTAIDQFKLAGGGFSCDCSVPGSGHGEGQAGTTALVALLALGGYLVTRRRHRAEA